jgi:hypothetical protein
MLRISFGISLCKNNVRNNTIIQKPSTLILKLKTINQWSMLNWHESYRSKVKLKQAM